MSRSPSIGRLGLCRHSSPIAEGAVAYFGDNEVKAVRLSSTLKEEEVWSDTVAGDIFCSPLLHHNVLFLATGKGELFAYDTGPKREPAPLIEARPLFAGEKERATPVTYSSLTLAGRYLFLSSNTGETVVLDAKRQAGLVARNKLPSGSGATPVFSGKDMFIRDGDALFCIGE